MKKSDFFLFGTPGIDGMTYFSGPLAVNCYIEDVEQLTSIDMVEALRELNTDYSIIYVANAFSRTDSNLSGEIKNRGAYYMHIGWKSDEPVFKEILLGSMFDASDNIDLLNSISEMDISDGVIVIENIDGEFKTKVERAKTIPDLPEYIKEQSLAYEENQEWENLGENQWSELDVEIDHLNRGDGKLGSCQKLYELLYSLTDDALVVDRKENGKLKFSILGKPTDDKPLKKQTIHLKDVMLERPKMTESPTNSSFYVVNFENISLGNNIFNKDKDQVLLAINDRFVNPMNFNWSFNRKGDGAFNILSFNVLKNFFTMGEMKETDDFLLTVLILKNVDGINNITSQEIYNEIFYETDSEITIDNLRYFIYKLYTVNRFRRLKPKQFVYLTNDMNGNVVWDNKFIANTKNKSIKRKILYRDVKETIIEGKAFIELGDVVVSSDVESLVFFDSLLVPDVDLKYIDGKLHVIIDTGGMYWNDDVDDPDDHFWLTILFHDSEATHIIHDLAKDYLTKRDAVDILTRGSMNLGEYLSKNDLENLSPRNHNHAGYSPVGHTHDHRYANTNHFHLEFNAYNDLLMSILNEMNMTEEHIEYVKTNDIFVQPSKNYYEFSENEYILVQDLNSFDPLTIDNLNIVGQENPDRDLNPVKIPFDSETSKNLYYGSSFKKRKVHIGDYYRYIETNEPDFTDDEKYYVLVNGGFERILDKIPGQKTYIYSDENIYGVKYIYFEKVLKLDSGGPVLSSYEMIKSLLDDYLIDLGLSVDSYGHLVPFIKSDKIIVEDPELKNYVEKDEVFVNDVLKKLKIKNEFMDSNRVKLDWGDSNISKFDIGSIAKGDVLPNDLNGFLSTLMTPKDILYKGVPHHAVVDIFNGDARVEHLTYDMNGSFSFDIDVLDMFDDEILLVSDDMKIFIKNNDEWIETHRISGINDRFELNGVEFGQDHLIEMKIELRNPFGEFEEFETISIELKSKFPKIIATSSDVLDIEELNYHIFYDDAIVEHPFGKYFIIGVDDFDIGLKDVSFGVIFGEKTLESMSYGKHEIQLPNSMVMKEYDFYIIPTMGDVGLRVFEIKDGGNDEW